jgi:hypothetical protein
VATDQQSTLSGDDYSHQLRNRPRHRSNAVSSSLEILGAYRENGLLRIRSGSAAAPGGKVLVHSVPRVRKRRHKKLEMRQATEEHTDATVGTTVSHQSTSSAAMSV